jgi:hypothetical protein
MPSRRVCKRQHCVTMWSVPSEATSHGELRVQVHATKGRRLPYDIRFRADRPMPPFSDAPSCAANVKKLVYWWMSRYTEVEWKLSNGM